MGAKCHRIIRPKAAVVSDAGVSGREAKAEQAWGY